MMTATIVSAAAAVLLWLVVVKAHRLGRSYDYFAESGRSRAQYDLRRQFRQRYAGVVCLAVGMTILSVGLLLLSAPAR